jgi:hypothetical protein
VEDLVGMKKLLEGRGVRFTGAPPGGDAIEYFSDPDATPLYLIEIRDDATRETE